MLGLFFAALVSISFIRQIIARVRVLENVTIQSINIGSQPLPWRLLL
ncbi:hypothetical protein PSM_A0630 [Pseudoalteromonas sp. SM9913]|nr:hypothetical protein PSM_A0630 [Pseudoalteromonas sp. SM9913]